MTTVSELVVAIRGEGVDQTQDELEGMEESVEESTESIDEQASALEELSDEFAGALQVAAVGLVAASASLLSQVPVVGQVFDGLFAIVQAVAFQMDQVLRPVLGPLSQKFFQLAGAIYELDGPLGTVVGIFGSLFALLVTVVPPVAFLLSKLGLLSGVVAKLSGVLAIVKGGLIALAGAISLPALAIGALAVAIGVALAIILTDFRGWRSSAISIITNFFNDAISALDRWIADTLDGFSSWVDNAADTITNIVDRVSDLGSLMLAAGRGLINSFINGIEARAGALRSTVESIMQDVRDYFPSSDAQVGPLSDVSKTGPGLVDEFATGIRSRQTQVTDATGSAVSASGSNSDGRLPRPRQTTTKLFIDGREAGRGTQSERFDETARRGQTF